MYTSYASTDQLTDQPTLSISNFISLAGDTQETYTSRTRESAALTESALQKVQTHRDTRTNLLTQTGAFYIAARMSRRW